MHVTVHTFRAAGFVAGNRRRRTKPTSAALTTDAPSTSSHNARAFEAQSSPLVAVVEALIRFPPLFNAAVRSARAKIMARGAALGLDFEAEREALQAARDWDAALREVNDPELVLPDYYTKPFHAYANGNLCFEAAFEVAQAAVAVHAPVMDVEGKMLDPEGDSKLRRSFSDAVAALLVDVATVRPVGYVLDIGCATGLSSCELARAHPNAAVTGIDLSPHMLALARHFQQERQASGTAEHITFMHAAGEATGLPGESQDLVSISLVAHELPQAATAAIFREAFRILRPGGVLALMDQNPNCAAFERLVANPFAFAAFKSTEPWLEEYIRLDLVAAMTDAGFGLVKQAENSPRHRTLVAVKS